ncbi:hypothetical protein H2201_004687 [Coniosporium apollinis]|uniref:peptidylprolyl isomerase n=2 Tax=Coniosporium TaxID=2810619 RepID=A0ABQ9NXB0_9PEZI|nr:hypothetical protein H2199_000629 [Cladosporium sp. JES 115]KAJ9665213.1 hypothetical protein H2201_004687 [Coniosporium apollinis]
MRLLPSLGAAFASVALISLPLVAHILPVHATDGEGLRIETTLPVGCSRRTHNGDKVSVHYRGTLQSDGSEFDASYNRGDPFSFVLGKGQVIKGWDQGLLDMCIGEERRLTIPPALGYGDRAMGSKIPAGSTLVFDTKLMGIQGSVGTPAATPLPTPAPEAAGSPGGPKDGDDVPDAECHLLGPFAIFVQGALGILALLSLVWKRHRERPRRPLKIWGFDVSKQVFGSVLLHLANLFMSMLSSGGFDVAAKAKEAAASVQEGQSKTPNPCSFYLLNLAIDTTIGIPILVLLLRLLHYGFSLTPLANPPESIQSGNYGRPPRVTWWLKQSIIYFLGLFGMKLCVFAIFQLLPWIAWIGDWALRWTEGNEALQITFVMFVFPLIMNGLQYYIIDGFIKDPAHGHSEYEAAPSEDEDENAGRRILRRGSDASSTASMRESLDGEPRQKSGMITTSEALKEANPTPVPNYNPETDGASSSGSSR